MIIPKGLEITRVSPTIDELSFINKWCNLNLKEGCKILEFGSGPSTWAIHTACKPSLYVAVEDWVPTLRNISKFVDVTFIRSLWYDIPEENYDLIFVDSSAGYPPGTPGLHRDEAIKYSERFLNNNGYIMIHDWRKRSGKAPRLYLENSGYKLVDSFNGRTGVGVYQK